MTWPTLWWRWRTRVWTLWTSWTSWWRCPTSFSAPSPSSHSRLLGLCSTSVGKQRPRGSRSGFATGRAGNIVGELFTRCKENVSERSYFRKRLQKWKLKLITRGHRKRAKFMLGGPDEPNASNWWASQCLTWLQLTIPYSNLWQNNINDQ